jgi:hypothetical protein
VTRAEAPLSSAGTCVAGQQLRLYLQGAYRLRQGGARSVPARQAPANFAAFAGEFAANAGSLSSRPISDSSYFVLPCQFVKSPVYLQAEAVLYPSPRAKIWSRMAAALEPCPVCGKSTGQVHGSPHDGFWVACRSCGGSTDVYPVLPQPDNSAVAERTRTYAVGRWNYRITPERRAEFTANQSVYLDAIFSLTANELAKKEEFYRLALDTFDALASIPFKIVFTISFRIRPTSGFNFLQDHRDHSLVQNSLVERWQDWAADYSALLDRNPRLALRDMIQDCSETHDGTSWPNSGWEADILYWVDTGTWDKPPFDDRQGVVDHEFFARLRQLRDRCEGWLFYEDAEKCVVFVPLTEARRRPLWFRPKQS